MKWTSINFDWNHVRAFLVTAEEGTLSAAAKALGLTQPTLSRQVAALEAELNVTLFERLGQRLVLTDSGLELFERAKPMCESAQQFSLAASGHSQQLEGPVVISASQLDAVFRLPNVIAQLRQEEPGIDIEVVVTNEASNLKRREADIAIRNFRPEQPDLIAKKLGEENIWLYASKEYIKRFSLVAETAIPSDLQIIGFERNKTLINQLSKQNWSLSKNNFKVVTQFQMMHLALCEKNLGLILFPEGMIDQHPSLERVFESSGPVMTLPVWLVCHQELRTSLRIRRVYDYIAQALSTSLTP